MKISYLLLAIALITSSCAYLNKREVLIEPDTFKEASKADIKDFFDGTIEVFGIKQDATGKIIGTQTARIRGQWEDNKGVIQQSFVNSDGTKDSRTWLVSVNDKNPDKFTAVGHDIVAPAQGIQNGGTIQMIYTIQLPDNNSMIADGKKNVRFEDRFYIIDDNSAILISTTKERMSTTGKAILSLKKVKESKNKQSKEVDDY